LNPLFTQKALVSIQALCAAPLRESGVFLPTPRDVAVAESLFERLELLKPEIYFRYFLIPDKPQLFQSLNPLFVQKTFVSTRTLRADP